MIILSIYVDETGDFDKIYINYLDSKNNFVDNMIKIYPYGVVAIQIPRIRRIKNV